MVASFIITFRETLEAALIIGIVLSYLAKIKQARYNNIIYVAVASAIVSSIIGAILFNIIAGGFEGRAEEIFEGISMLVGAFLLTTMILWMMKQKHISEEIEKKVSVEINTRHRFGLFFLVFIAVLREGIETVIFLNAAKFISKENNLFAALGGVVFAIILGYLIFVLAKKINLRMFFNITNVLLILFAAGLVAHGIHELQEAHMIPIIREHIWDINPVVKTAGTYPLLHENGYIGSIFKGLFGYNGNPNLLEIVGYALYLISISLTWKIMNSKKA